jgi:hypothetical protein
MLVTLCVCECMRALLHTRVYLFVDVFMCVYFSACETDYVRVCASLLKPIDAWCGSEAQDGGCGTIAAPPDAKSSSVWRCRASPKCFNNAEGSIIAPHWHDWLTVGQANVLYKHNLPLLTTSFTTALLLKVQEVWIPWLLQRPHRSKCYTVNANAGLTMLFALLCYPLLDAKGSVTPQASHWC